IVGMDRVLRAELSAQKLVRAIGDHLVDIHVGLRARPRLPHDQRKMLVEPALAHLAGGPDDRPCAAGIEQAERVVHFGGGELDDAERVDQRARNALAPDREVLEGALGLRAPVTVGRDLDRAEAIGLDANLCAYTRAARRAPGTPIPPALRNPHRLHFLRIRSNRTTWHTAAGEYRA